MHHEHCSVQHIEGFCVKYSLHQSENENKKAASEKLRNWTLRKYGVGMPNTPTRAEVFPVSIHMSGKKIELN